MSESSTFDRLAASLSMEERRSLLAKLSSLGNGSMDPLFREEELPETVDIERRFREAPWYTRFFYFLRGLFKSKPPVRLFDNSLLSRLGSSIESRAPGLYDYHRSLLLPGFLEELNSLKESARFFYDALDTAFSRDKSGFFAFLFSLEMDFTYQRLVQETDPQLIAQSNSSAQESHVKQMAYKALDDILQTIDETQRRRMYQNARSLQCLWELSSFLYDRLISTFSRDGVSDGLSCPTYLVVDQLYALNNILVSLKTPPSIPLLESLFVFLLQDRMAEPAFDMAAETENLLTRSEEALSRIRQFNQRIPLTAILRCASRNLAYLPQAISGGEDWFAVFRDYWKKRIEERYERFLRERRRETLTETFNSFFNGIPLQTLENVGDDTNTEGIHLRKSFMLSFLLTFYQSILLNELNRALKPILIDGEFYKKENRSEFTEAYNSLLKLGDEIQALLAKIAPSGDIGKRYRLVQSEMIALAVKRRKIQSLEMEVSEEASGIIDRASRALRSLIHILGGILNGEAGGKYDSLVNLGSLSGKGGSYLGVLRNALQRIEKTVQLIGEIDAMEAGV